MATKPLGVHIKNNAGAPNLNVFILSSAFLSVDDGAAGP
jgi:hypothetical protein